MGAAQPREQLMGNLHPGRGGVGDTLHKGAHQAGAPNRVPAKDMLLPWEAAETAGAGMAGEELRGDTW